MSIDGRPHVIMGDSSGTFSRSVCFAGPLLTFALKLEASSTRKVGRMQNHARVPRISSTEAGRGKTVGANSIDTLEIACTRCATTASLNGRQALLIVRRSAVEIY
jgi:hypothetical protein